MIATGGRQAALPLLMTGLWRVSPGQAAAFVGWTRLAGVCSPYLIALLSDRWERTRVLLLVLAVSLLAVGLAIPLTYGPAFTVLVTVLTLFISGSTPVFYALVSERYAAQRELAVGSIGGVASLLGSAVSPVVFGYLIEHATSGAVFGTAAGIALLGLVALAGMATAGVPAGEVRNGFEKS